MTTNTKRTGWMEAVTWLRESPTKIACSPTTMAAVLETECDKRYPKDTVTVLIGSPKTPIELGWHDGKVMQRLPGGEQDWYHSGLPLHELSAADWKALLTLPTAPIHAPTP